jgi:hypothetical protein
VRLAQRLLSLAVLLAFAGCSEREATGDGADAGGARPLLVYVVNWMSTRPTGHPSQIPWRPISRRT